MKILVTSALCVITFLFIVSCAAAPTTTNNSGGDGGGGAIITSMYIATNGSDSNTGLTKADPLLSIQYAVDIAKANNYTASFYIQEGYYTTNAGLTNAGTGITLVSNNNYRFYGGCDTNFDPQPGHVSVLDGRNILDKLVMVINSTNIVLDGFLFLRGNAVANSWGGSILLRSVYHSLITNCGFLSNNGFNGGAVCLSNSGTNVINAYFANNFGGNGGALYIYGGSYANGIYSSFSNNTSTASGGAIYFFGGGNSTLISGVFVGNRTTGNNSRGGAISINTESSTIIFDSVFCNNSATGGGNYGGAIASWGSQTRILNSLISNNLSGLHGGGVHFSGANSLLSNCTVANNRVTNATDTCIGGGVNILAQNVLIYSCAVTGNGHNYIDVRGGGISMGSDYGRVEYSLISGNNGYIGGGIHIIGTYNLVTNSLISNNMADLRGGGVGIMSAYNTVNSAVVNNLVTNNAFTPLGGGIYVGGDYCSIYGIISNNSTPTGNGYGGGIATGGQSTLINAVVCGNYAYNSGGIHLTSYSNHITGTIINNTCALHGSGIYFVTSAATNFLIGAVLTNNTSTGNFGCIGAEQPVLLTISNNLIGCGTANEYGIYEPGGSDTYGHILVGNIFITNRMAGAYYDDGFLGFTPANFAWINDTNKTTALSASGNTAIVQ